MSTAEERAEEARPVAMCPHVDDHWTCAGLDCGRTQCAYCDGSDNGSGLCWACFNAEPDHETAVA